MDGFLVFPIDGPSLDSWITCADVFGNAYLLWIGRRYASPNTVIDLLLDVERDDIPDEANATDTTAD